MRRLPALALIALALTPLAGCGGTAQNPHEAWVGKADAICRTTNERGAPLTARMERLADTGLGRQAQLTEAATLLRESLPVLATEIDELSNLRPPVADQPRAAGLLRAFELKRSIVRELIPALAQGSATELDRVLRRLLQSETSERRWAHRLGLTVCGDNAIHL